MTADYTPFNQDSRSTSTGSLGRFITTSFNRLSIISRIRKRRVVPQDSKKNETKRPVMHKSATVSSLSDRPPIIYYNGPFDTLDQLPEEKFSWITRETVGDTSNEELRHPRLLNYPRPVAFKKPTNKRQSL
jgi:hypothetical protein